MLEWFRRHFTQDDFADDWYGYLTNQVSHVGLGLFLALFVAISWFIASGEMPFKWPAWFVCLGLYLSLEIVRGWHGWDSAEDTMFTCGYGSGGAFLLFSEITPGDPALLLNLPMAGAVSVAMIAHLVWGVSRRW